MDAEYFVFIDHLLRILSRCDAQYAIGGSFASSIYGEVRSTYDVDISLYMDIDKTTQFLTAIQEQGWYVSPEAVINALVSTSEFQVIDGTKGLKANFYVVNALTPRQQQVLERRRLLPYGIHNKTAFFMSPEDVILYKIEWFIKGNSQKHIRDIAAMLTENREHLDFEYIRVHLKELDAEKLWDELFNENEKRNGS